MENSVSPINKGDIFVEDKYKSFRVIFILESISEIYADGVSLQVNRGTGKVTNINTAAVVKIQDLVRYVPVVTDVENPTAIPTTGN